MRPAVTRTTRGLAGAAGSRGPNRASVRKLLAAPVLVGAVCGLAWAAALRGLMSELAGPQSAVTWYGTFVQILLPGVLTGALLGHATRHRSRAFVLAPLLFVLAVFLSAAAFEGRLFEGGVGGGAVALPLFGIAGGHALAGRSPMWTRALTGLLAAAPIALWPLTNAVFGPDFAVTTPRGAWIALYLYAEIAILALACSIPFRSRQPASA